MKHHEIIAINECKKANAAGVEHFLNGNLSASVNSFTHGLAIAKGILSEFDDAKEDSGSLSSDNSFDRMDIDKGNEGHQPCSSSNDDCAENNTIPAVAVPLHNGDNSRSIDNFSCAITSCKDDQILHYVYRTPLEVTAPTVDFSRYEARVELAVAIMFNLALCHHLTALSKVKEDKRELRERLLDQALSLYELAYMFQVQEDIEVSNECTMGIINNLGQIHHLKGDHEQASRCFRHLLSTILFVHSYARDDDDCDDDDSERPLQTEVFVRSVSHLVLKEVVAPAA